MSFTHTLFCLVKSFCLLPEQTNTLIANQAISRSAMQSLSLRCICDLDSELDKRQFSVASIVCRVSLSLSLSRSHTCVRMLTYMSSTYTCWFIPPSIHHIYAYIMFSLRTQTVKWEIEKKLSEKKNQQNRDGPDTWATTQLELKILHPTDEFRYYFLQKEDWMRSEREKERVIMAFQCDKCSRINISDTRQKCIDYSFNCRWCVHTHRFLAIPTIRTMCMTLLDDENKEQKRERLAKITTTDIYKRNAYVLANQMSDGNKTTQLFLFSVLLQSPFNAIETNKKEMYSEASHIIQMFHTFHLFLSVSHCMWFFAPLIQLRFIRFFLSLQHILFDSFFIPNHSR